MLDVKVKIEVSKPTSGVGFGIPLLLVCGAEAEKAYTECYSLEEVVTAGYSNETEMYKAAAMLFAQENRPAKIAVCSVKEAVDVALPKLISKDWRQLIVVGGTTEDYGEAAEYIETTSKMLFISMSAEDFTTFKGSLTGKTYNRTVIFVNKTAYAAAALVGETAGRAAGSFTYKFMQLKNVEPEIYTEAEIKAFHAAGAFVYVTKAGDNVTSEGIAQSGEYIDEIDCIDYVVQNIEYRIQKLFNNTAKVPYDDRGIALVESATVSALQDAFTNGIIAVKEDGTTPDYSVSFAARSATTEADRASRVYKYGSFTFALAGAIHECEVYGEITY